MLPRATVKNLTISGQYSINLVSENAHTHSIQVSDSRDGTVLVDLPLDPMDNMLASAVEMNVSKKLGADAETVFAVLSQVLREQIGAKEFVVMPVGVDLSGYVRVEMHEFNRSRQAARVELAAQSGILLDQYRELVSMLDEQYELVVGAEQLSNRLAQPYLSIFHLLEKHARFTAEKMIEYKTEDLLGMYSRVNNRHVLPIGMVNRKSGHLCGFLRSLDMKNGFAYLSDETIDQNIVSLDSFAGETPKEKEKNRDTFLLAYFMNKAADILRAYDQFLIIAADKREANYDAVGFRAFPLNSDKYVARMKFGKRGPLLDAIKARILTPAFSNVSAIVSLGMRASPLEAQMKNEAPQNHNQEKPTIKYN